MVLLGAVAVATEVRERSVTDGSIEGVAAARSKAACHTDGLVHGLVPPHQRGSTTKNLIVVAKIPDFLQILVADQQFRPENRLIMEQQLFQTPRKLTSLLRAAVHQVYTDDFSIPSRLASTTNNLVRKPKFVKLNNKRVYKYIKIRLLFNYLRCNYTDSCEVPLLIRCF